MVDQGIAARGAWSVGDLPPEAEWLDHAESPRGGWEFRNADGKVPACSWVGGKGAEYGVTDNRHVFTVAGSRAGKGASLIVPNLLQYEGSVVAIDPKGELARITADIGGSGLASNVVVLDPFGRSGHASAAFNPLDAVDLNSPEALDDAMAIAEAMIQVPQHGEAHWAESAQAVVQAVVLLVKLLEDKEGEANLSDVHEFLMLTHATLRGHAERSRQDKLVKALFDLMIVEGERISERHEEVATVLQGVGMMYFEMSDKERESVLSSARTQTRFLRSPALRAILGKSSLSLQQIKREPTTVYLCLPVKRMVSHARWLRIVINLCLQSFEDDVEPKIPVLMVLDEFNVLGHMPSIETAAGQLGGFGVKLWTIVQDIGQIKKHYGQDAWETFVGNAGVLTFFGNTDYSTLQYIERKLGKRTFLTERPSGDGPGARYAGAAAMRQELRDEALLATDEIAECLGRSREAVLVLAAGKKPVILQRAHYYDEKDRFYKLAHGE